MLGSSVLTLATRSLRLGPHTLHRLALPSATPALPRLFTTAVTAPSSESNTPVEQVTLVEQPKAKISWIDAYFPERVRPFLKSARVDRPIGTMLLLWPCWWGVALATPQGRLPDPVALAMFGVGSFFWRGAGCVINEILDQDFDRKVSRTATRPIASGALSVPEAFGFMVAQAAIPLAMMATLDKTSFVLGSSNFLIVLVYPLMKRITYWPQAVLGVTYNWGIPLAWSAAYGSINVPAVLPMYLAGVAWTIHYDTIYAHQDRADDVKYGVKSTAVLFGDDTKKYLTGFSALTVAGLALTGVTANLSWPYYASVAYTAGHLAWQVAATDLNNAQDCSDKFVANQSIGAAIFAGIVAARSGWFD